MLQNLFHPYTLYRLKSDTFLASSILAESIIDKLRDKIIQIGRNKLPKCKPETGVRVKIPGVPYSVKVVRVDKSKVTIDTKLSIV